MAIQRPEAVLIVDDDDHYVRAMTRQLRELGFPFVYRAASADQAIAMLQRVHPTLVLTDIVIDNQLSGRDLIGKAKGLGASVAVVSGLPGLLEEELGVRVQRKSDLQGRALEGLLFELIEGARQRSRDSVRVTERVA